MNSSIQKLEEIYASYNVSFITYYIKVHCIQAPFEAFMGAFLYVWALTFVHRDINKDLIIILPVLLSSIVCFFFLVVINTRFLLTLYRLRTSFSAQKVNYDKVENELKKLSWSIHITGVFCYAVVTITILLIMCGGNFLVDWRNGVFLLVGIGVGIVWNFRGYYGDMRIDWRKVNKRDAEYFYEEQQNGLNAVRKEKLKFTIIHIIINIVTIFIMICAYMVLTVNSLDLPLDIDKLEIGSNEFFIIAFIICLINYIKILYPLFYSQKGSIYYDFKDLFVDN